MGLNLAAFAGDWNGQIHTITFPTTDPIQIVSLDTRRWALWLMAHTSAFFILPLFPSNSVGTPVGFQIQPGADRLITYKDVGALIGAPWFAATSGGAVTLDVFEVLSIR